MEKHKKQLIAVYIVFLVLGSLFVRSVLKTDKVDVKKKNPEPPAVEVKPVKVELRIYQGETYNVRMQNVDSVLDLLENLRLHSGFWYEKIAYTDGVEIDGVDHVEAPPGYKWKVFSAGEDITYNIGNIYLENENVYEIRLVQIDY